MTETGSSVVEAKKLYTTQLIELLTPTIYNGLKSIYDSSKESDTVLKTFQEKLCSVVRWNQNIIDKEYDRITRNVDEGYLSGLIDAVFISNVKVLSSIRISDTKKIDVKVPDPKIFIHKAYIECARQMYQDPFLMDDRESELSHSEIQRNVKRSKNIIGISIEKTIRDLIPIQEIIESYLVDIGIDDIKEDFSEDILPENNKEPEETEGSVKSDTGNASEDEDYFMKEPRHEESNWQEPDNQNLAQESNLGSSFEDKPDLEVTTGNTISETPGGFVGDTIDKKIILTDQEQVPQEKETSYDDANFFSDSD
jgi:hypothetical protein